jgi:hypothetical protein
MLYGKTDQGNLFLREVKDLQSRLKCRKCVFIRKEGNLEAHMLQSFREDERPWRTVCLGRRWFPTGDIKSSNNGYFASFLRQRDHSAGEVGEGDHRKILPVIPLVREEGGREVDHLFQEKNFFANRLYCSIHHVVIFINDKQKS